MIQRATGKLFIISFIVSILLHTGLFTWLFFSGDSFYLKPGKDSPLLYSVSLEYFRRSPENREETGVENGLKPAPRKIQQKEIKKEFGDETNNKPDTSPAAGLLAGFPIDGSGNTDITTIDTIPPGEYNNPGNGDILFKELSDKIQENIIYPPAARRRGIEGTVTVFFIIDRQGCLVKSKVEKTSGYSILDKAALKVIERSLPHPHMLNRQVELKVSIIYTLE
jgi:TonB family protein